jgi:hypothetical protein
MYHVLYFLVLIRSSFEGVRSRVRTHTYTYVRTHTESAPYIIKKILAFANQVPVVRKCPLHTGACTYMHAHAPARAHTHTHTHTQAVGIVMDYLFAGIGVIVVL